jgi:hypothetical protein
MGMFAQKLPPKFFVAILSLQFLEKYFQKGVTFQVYQVSIVVYVDFLHHPTFPRGVKPAGIFLSFYCPISSCWV